MKLGILATHPIQYHAPLFRELANRDGVETHVFFCHRPTAREQGTGFGVDFQWDVDLTAGYPHTWLENASTRPALDTYAGCDTPDIRQQIRPGRFDAFIVHGWFARSCWQAFRACWQTRTPLVVRGDSQLPPQPSFKTVLKRLVYPRLMRRFTLALAYGERSRHYFEYYGSLRTAVSCHFVENERFSIPRAKPERPRFIFCGKLIGKKRPLDVIEALRQVDGAELLVVGDGDMRASCERAARGLPVTFSGFKNQSEIAQAYASADALVLPSDHRETWGLVVNEAMASGLPVIVADQCGCVPDLVEGHGTGVVFSTGNVPELANAMTALLDPKRRQSMAKRAQEHILCFSPAIAADQLLEAL